MGKGIHNLIFEFVSWVPLTGSRRIATLNHKIFDNPVENDAVVIWFVFVFFTYKRTLSFRQRDKISNCDLIVTVTSHVDHSVSECVKQLKDAQVLAGECIRVSCHGKSGLVREVLNYFADPMRSSEMA